MCNASKDQSLPFSRVQKLPGFKVYLTPRKFMLWREKKKANHRMCLVYLLINAQDAGRERFFNRKTLMHLRKAFI